MDQHSCWCFTSENINNKKQILYNNFDPPPNLAISVSMSRSASRRRLIFGHFNILVDNQYYYFGSFTCHMWFRGLRIGVSVDFHLISTYFPKFVMIISQLICPVV